MERYGAPKDPLRHLASWTEPSAPEGPNRAQRRIAAFNRRAAARRVAAARARAALAEATSR